MKTAAIWWRVSTDEQREISPDTQTGEALALAEQEGYNVPPENIIGTDWSSLSVWNSPTMGQLKALVLDRAITAIFMYDADRGPSKPAHRLMFRALCEENGVAVRCCHGEIPGGEMGELMEFISAWSKEKQVHRAQQGAKDGLRDRAKKRGLPTNGTAPLGYQFRYQDLNGKRIPVALEPDSNYPVAQMIWRLAHAPDKPGAIRPGHTGTEGWCLLESQHRSRHTQQPRLRWPLLLTPRDSKNPCPAAQGGLLQIVGPTTPLRRLALAGGFPCYVPRRHLGRLGDCATAAGPEQNRCHPQRQAHLLASGNVVLLRRRQASGRPL